MRSTPFLALPASLALVTGVIGCGDKALTRAKYVNQADAICKDFTERQDKLGKPKTLNDIERLGDKTKSLAEKQLSKLRDLKAPDDIADDAKAYGDLTEKQVASIDDLVGAAKAKDVKKIQSIVTSAAKTESQADAKAKAIGFKVCGKNKS